MTVSDNYLFEDSEDAEAFLQTTLSQLTLEEKVTLLSGSDFVAASGVPRISIPAIGLVDSVNSVKGLRPITGTPTLCFPSTTCLGATWNTSLIFEMGQELANQAKHKRASVILGPTVNICRDPRGGRNFEAFSEDPLLTGKLAGAMINGIQDGGVSACPKHFVANESETERRFYDVKESANGRTIREIYLAAFQHLLRGSDPWAIMTSYNKLSGIFCSEHPMIKAVLREEWGFRECIMSDWFGTRSGLPALQAGLDLEMPGPSVFRGRQLVEDVIAGLASEDLLNERVRKVLRLIFKTRQSHSTEPERPFFNEYANLLARRVAAEGLVLLKNSESALPLRTKTSPKIAVIGPYATNPPIGGGGSAKGIPQYIQKPLHCLRSSNLSTSSIKYTAGCTIHQIVPALPLFLTRASNDEPGIDVAYFKRGIHEPVLEEILPSNQTSMLGYIKSPLSQDSFSHYIVSTTLRPLTSGNHTIALQTTGAFSLTINSVPVMSSTMSPAPKIEDFLFVPSNLETTCTYVMVANLPYTITATIKPHNPEAETGEPRVHAAKFGFLEEYSDSQLRAEAVEVAKDSAVSIIFAGRNHEYESEGFDLTTIRLPLVQERMITEVAQASQKTILILYGGNPVDISAYEHLVDAIIFAHFPGQEGGQALVDIITGKSCPSGRLSMSWPNCLEEVASFENFPAKNVDYLGAGRGKWEIRYAEGLKVGYRDPELKSRYPFGYGLSYTSFTFSDLSCKAVHSSPLPLYSPQPDCGLPTPPSEMEPRNLEQNSPKDITLSISVKVTNSGSVAGQEVVQVYFRPPSTSEMWRPKEELKAFSKVYLQPGDSEIVEMSIDQGVALSYWDDRVKGEECWRAEAGDYGVRVEELRGVVTLDEEFCWRGL